MSSFILDIHVLKKWYTLSSAGIIAYGSVIDCRADEADAL